MATTIQGREKELRRQGKQRTKSELRQGTTRREHENQGPATADANLRAKKITDADGHDVENPT